MSSTKFVFFGWSEKQDGGPGLWLAETFSTSPLKPPNGIQQNLTGSKISTTSTKFVFFGPIGKTRWPPWPLIGWDILDFSSETAERPATKLDRKKDLNVLFQVCVFGPIGKTRWPPWPIGSKMWHIVLRCTICGPLGLLFDPVDLIKNDRFIFACWWQLFSKQFLDVTHIHQNTTVSYPTLQNWVLCLYNNQLLHIEETQTYATLKTNRRIFNDKAFFFLTT